MSAVKKTITSSAPIPTEGTHKRSYAEVVRAGLQTLQVESKDKDIMQVDHDHTYCEVSIKISKTGHNDHSYCRKIIPTSAPIHTSAPISPTGTTSAPISPTGTTSAPISPTGNKTKKRTYAEVLCASLQPLHAESKDCFSENLNTGADSMQIEHDHSYSDVSRQISKSDNNDHSYCKKMKTSSLLKAKANPPKVQVTSHVDAAINKNKTAEKSLDDIYVEEQKKDTRTNTCKPQEEEITLKQTFRSDFFVSTSQSSCRYETMSNNTIAINNQLFQVTNVPGDGNCFFHTLSLFQNETLSQTRNLRNKICSTIIQDFQNWSDEISLFHESCNSITSYHSHMLQGTGWATVCEIKAACLLLKCKINVYLITNKQRVLKSVYSPRQTNQVTNNKEMHILLHNNHFQLLQIIEPQDRAEGNTVLTEQIKKNQLKAGPGSVDLKGINSCCVQEKVINKTHTIAKSSKSKPKRRQSSQSHLKNRKQKQSQKKKPRHSRKLTSTDNQNTTVKQNSEWLDVTKDFASVNDSHSCIVQSDTNICDQNSSECTDNVNTCDKTKTKDLLTQSKCRKIGISFEAASSLESEQEFAARNIRNLSRIKYRLKKFKLSLETIPEEPPITNDKQFNKAMDCIRSFELLQMSYDFNLCSVCKERKLSIKNYSKQICHKCTTDKHQIKMFSDENKMNPGIVPLELQNLTMTEQQLISRISPCISVYMLKHGGLATKGHCVTFPQEVNEPASLFPRLPHEVNVVRVRRQGKNDSSKDFRVRRYVVQNALSWLKENNPVYSDITICNERLSQLPLDDEVTDISTVEFKDDINHTDDEGPAPEQTDPGDLNDDCITASSTLIPDQNTDIEKEKHNFLNEIINHKGEKFSRRNTITIPWPTRNNEPISEFTTRNFFTLAFPTLFPYGTGDFHMNRPRTCTSLSDWANHLLWFEDGRFAKHQVFKFIAHNMIIRKRTLETSNYIIHQKLGEDQLSISDLKQKIQNGDKSVGEKIVHLGSTLRGTSQYWAQRCKELRSLIQFNINEGNGLPSFFATGSCAEFYFKPLKKTLTNYIKETTGNDIDLDDKNNLFKALQENTHIVADYFEKRTHDYFQEVLKPVFGVESFWYRQEFAKSRGMIHWHGLCWRGDREPHSLLYDANNSGLNDDEIAEILSKWAENEFRMTASHPAGKNENGESKKDLWPPPEGTAQAPPEEKNPLTKLLMNVSESQQTLFEDYLLLTNRVNLHRCSDYCLRPSKNKKSSEKICRLEFGSSSSPGKELRDSPALVRDKNGCLRLEMARDHPALVQHSRYHTQGWRANGDISIILSKSGPDNPSVDDIIATEAYITGYACKGGKGTGAIVDLFNDMVNATNENENLSAKSVCTKLLMQTTKRDISAVEAAYELSSLPLYRCSHSFQNVSLSGSRLLERTGSTLTKQTSLDKYLARPEKDKSSWYDFVCNSGYVPVISGGNVRCSWPLDEDFCRTMMLLHTPNWRKIDDLKNENQSWLEKFTEFLNSVDCPNFVKANVEKALRYNEDTDCSTQDDEIDEENVERPEWAELLHPNPNYQNEGDFQYDDGGPDYDWSKCNPSYPQDLGVSFLENLNNKSEDEQESSIQIPDVEILQLNKEQRLAFDIVMNTLLDYKSSSDQYKPLRLVVAGTAGSGKSYLIKCLVKAIRLLFETNKCVQVLCPTGNSANLISGVTIHSFLKIPTTGRSKELSAPPGKTGEKLQKNCQGLHVLLVDERSLIGCTTLGWMEFMCRFGKNSDSSWGGLPVVVFLGDDVQLPPVLDSPLYRPNSKCPASLHGSLVWQEFSSAVTLQSIIRQNQDQNQLKDVLTALRGYEATQEHSKWLQNFQWDDLKRSYGDQLMSKMNEDGLFVFPTHSDEWNHNKSKLLETNKVNPIAKIDAMSTGVHASNTTSDKAGGLQNTLYLCKGAKVMLTSNLLVECGLFNGSMGKVIDIIYPQNKRPGDCLPIVVMVEFHKYTGPPFIENNPKLVPIVQVKRKLECPCFSCSRTQIPLRLGWGTTIHKCQGMTIGLGESSRYIVINPGSKKFESLNPGALFVALSRAKTAGSVSEYPDFAWHPSVLVNEDRICHIVNTNTTRARTKEIKRIEEMSKRTEQEYSRLLERNKTLQEFVNKLPDKHRNIEE